MGTNRNFLTRKREEHFFKKENFLKSTEGQIKTHFVYAKFTYKLAWKNSKQVEKFEI